MEVDAAYAVCERITRTRAANFFYGIRLLPPPKRRALSAVYAFARQIDDIGDGGLPPPAKAAALAQAREQFEAPGNGATDPVITALHHAADRFPIPLDAFGDLIDGVEMDVHGTTYETYDDLVVYCRCVAGSIGRLSLGVFESRDMARAEPLADALGVALQLTNILRDVREDLATGPRLPAAGGLDGVCLRAARAAHADAGVRGANALSRPSAPRGSSTWACSCCRCWTGAARPAPPPWPASTARCCGASRRTRPP